MECVLSTLSSDPGRIDANQMLAQWQRAETLGALVNGVFLVALCVSIFLEAIQRLVEPQEVKNGKLVCIVGCLGLLSNIIGLVLFHDHSHGPGHGHGHAVEDVEAAEYETSHDHSTLPHVDTQRTSVSLIQDTAIPTTLANGYV